MNSEKDKTAPPDDYVPLSVRDDRQMRGIGPHLWISFAAIIILAAAGPRCRPIGMTHALWPEEELCWKLN